MSKDMMKAYRVEDQERGHGIWRDFDGTVNPVFSQLTQGKCKDMPMEDSDFYRYDGKQWFSATDTPEKLKAWFSALDVIEMQDLGYSVFEFDISSCRVVSEYEICFTRDSILSQKKIDPRSIYGEEYEKALAERRKVKQIEEMTNDLYDNRPYEELWLEDAEDVARVLYNAGYRKQSEDVTDINVGCKSEWISVEERLPDKGQEVLVYRGDFNGDMMNTYTYLGGLWDDD